MKSKTLLFAALCLILIIPWTSSGAQNEVGAKLLAENGNAVICLVVLDRDKNEIARGSAVVLSETVAVTSYHLVCKAGNINGLNAQKKKIDVDGILAVDKKLDLALLQIDGKVKILNPGPALATAQSVVAMGMNESGDTAVSEGTLRNIFEVEPNVKVADSTLAVADTFDGGAVLDESGNLLGLLNVFERRLKFVVPFSALTALKPGPLVKFKAWTPDDYMDSVEAGWLSGRLLMWMDENYAAVRGLDKVVKAQPNNIEAWKYLALVYEKQRDYSKALESYQKLAALEPSNAAAFAGIGTIQARTSKFKEAIPNLEKALELDSSQVSVYKSLGEAYEGLHEWAKAGDAYDKYLASNPPDRAQIYRTLGNIRGNAEQYALAAAAYAEFIKLNPDDAYQYYQMAQMLEKAGKLEEAEAAYIKTGEVAKEPGKYFTSILVMYDNAKRSDKAIEACQKMIALDPKNDESYYQLGNQYSKANKNAEAVEAFKKTVEINPKHEYAWFQMGVGYYQLKDYTQAIVAFQKTVANAPDQFYGWLYMGMCELTLKRYKASVESLKKAVELKPDNTDALFNLGVAYINLRDKPNALDIVKKLEPISAERAAKLKSYIKF
jgi:tetratricopeptide (TPR) repeat protein